MSNELQDDELCSLEAIYDGDPDMMISIPSRSNGVNAGQGCGEHLRVDALITVEQPRGVSLHISGVDPKSMAADAGAPKLLRSKSGAGCRTARQLQRLPPIRLAVFLPHGYLQGGLDEHVAPGFELSALWLTPHHLSSLCKELDRLWNEHLGEPILFLWLEWLRADSLSFLKMLQDDTLRLATSSDASPDARAVEGLEDPREILKTVVAWDEAREREKVREYQPCCNCQERVHHNGRPITLCCNHVLCLECIAIMDTMHAAASDAIPRCPLPHCRTKLRAPLSGEDLSMHAVDALAWILGTPLQGSLVFCPMCESLGVDTPVAYDVVEKSKKRVADSSHECKCYRCDLNFCGTCRSPSHPGEECAITQSRFDRMLRRRPALPKSIEDELKRFYGEEAKPGTPHRALWKEDFKDFESFRDKFLNIHGEAVRKSLYDCTAFVGDFKPAPMAEDVQGRFMQSVRDSISMRQRRIPDVRPAFHGTTEGNHASIFKRGLLIPGKGNDLQIVNGAVHGRGIYTANVDAAWLSLGFCSGPRILFCAVMQSSSVTHPGDAMVVFDPSHVIPLYEVSFSRTCYLAKVNLTPSALQHIANAAAGAVRKKGGSKSKAPRPALKSEKDEELEI